MQPRAGRSAPLTHLRRARAGDSGSVSWLAQLLDSRLEEQPELLVVALATLNDEVASGAWRDWCRRMVSAGDRAAVAICGALEEEVDNGE